MTRRPFHPFAFAVFPVCFLFAQNAALVSPGKVVWPLIFVLAGTALAMVVASLVLRDVRRGALVASGAVLLMFSYGHVLPRIGGRDAVLLPVWAVLSVAVLVVAWRIRRLDDATALVNAISVGIFAVALFGAGTALARHGGQPLQTRAGEESESVAPATKAGDKPDIYYLIFDRYASSPVLDTYMDFDNHAFLDALRDRGFSVADRSMSNYPTTAHSLASSLNIDYLDDVASERTEDWRPLYDELVGTKVTRFLQRQGYRYAHIGSWYDPTAHDRTAQVNYHYDKRSEFSRVLIGTTVLHPIASRIGVFEDLDGRRVAHNQIRFQFASIREAGALEGPTFVFAHLLLPHEPFTFDAGGGYVSEQQEAPKSYEEAYLAQVRFTNDQILSTIDAIFERDEEAVIVLQADEGPKLLEWRYGVEDPWTDATDAELQFKTGILNAIHAPDAKLDLSSSATPVNTFRKILNAYFDTDLRMLRERIYVYGDKTEPFLFTEVTDRVRRRGLGPHQMSPSPKRATAKSSVAPHM